MLELVQGNGEVICRQQAAEAVSIAVFSSPPLPAVPYHPFLALVTSLRKIAEARVQQKARNLQPEGLRDVFIIAVHRETKPGQLCNNAIAMLESDGPGWLPFSDVAK
jgi:hypothetical protein